MDQIWTLPRVELQKVYFSLQNLSFLGSNIRVAKSLHAKMLCSFANFCLDGKRACMFFFTKNTRIYYENSSKVRSTPNTIKIRSSSLDNLACLTQPSDLWPFWFIEKYMQLQKSWHRVSIWFKVIHIGEVYLYFRLSFNGRQKEFSIHIDMIFTMFLCTKNKTKAIRCTINFNFLRSKYLISQKMCSHIIYFAILFIYVLFYFSIPKC